MAAFDFTNSLAANVIIGFLIFWFGLWILIFFIYLCTRIRVVEQGTAMVVERWGKYHRRLDEGIHILQPFSERPRSIIWREYEVLHKPGNVQEVKINQKNISRIDLRESVLDFPLQSIITRDNVEIQIHPLLIYRVVDPVRVVYEVYDITHAVEKLVQTTLRSIIGDMGLDDTLASREEINRTLSQKLGQIFQNWGFKLIKVEILEIIPTATIQEAMHKQIAAERIRRAAIITADGYREQVKTESEGECQSVIALAKGQQQVKLILAKAQSDSKLIVAQAEADGLTMISEALGDTAVDPTQYLIGLRYIDTLVRIAQKAKSKLMYFPFTASITGAFGKDKVE